MATSHSSLGRHHRSHGDSEDPENDFKGRRGGHHRGLRGGDEEEASSRFGQMNIGSEDRGEQSNEYGMSENYGYGKSSYGDSEERGGRRHHGGERYGESGSDSDNDKRESEHGKQNEANKDRYKKHNDDSEDDRCSQGISNDSEKKRKKRKEKEEEKHRHRRSNP